MGMDLKELETLFKEMKKAGLASMHIKQGPLDMVVEQAAVQSPKPLKRECKHIPHNTKQEESMMHYITASHPGKFRAHNGNDTTPLVSVGDVVAKDQCVGYINMLAVNIEIVSDCKGEITAMLVEHNASVEYGQPLFEIHPKD
jgi:biotin carboxyl carrier protein